MNVLSEAPVHPFPTMSSVQHITDHSSGKNRPSHRKHPSSNSSSLLYRQKRQRRQAAGAMVAGMFAGGNNSADESVNDGTAVTPTKHADGQEKKSKKKSTAQPRPEIQIPPRGIGPIYEPNENDVLCGRGGRINAHPGNVCFRDVVVQRKKEYLAPTTKKLEKAYIAADIVRDIRAKEPSGRFLKEDPDGAWYDIGDAKAIKKVGQALREDAPDVREDNGSDEDQDGGESSKVSAPSKKATPAEEAKKLPAAVTHPLAAIQPIPAIQSAVVTHTLAAIQPIATVQIPGTTTATAVSGRGAKVITSSQRPASQPKQQAYTTLGYQPASAASAQYQPILPPTHESPSKPFFPGIRGRGAKSGAAAAAMRNSDDNPSYPPPPTQDVAFGRHFHIPEPGAESSMISGMSGISSATGGGKSGPSASALSGMSGISALTDPISSLSGKDDLQVSNRQQSFQYPMARPHTAQEFQAMRHQQLQHLRQQWEQGSQKSCETSDLRSIGEMSIQRSHSWQSGFFQRRPGDNMSWADHSLQGGGIHDGSSIVSGQLSFHSYYLRDQPMGGSIPVGASVFGSGSSGPGESAMLRTGSSGIGSMSLLGSFAAQSMQHQQSAMVPPGQFYFAPSSSSNGEDSSDKTNRMSGGIPSGGGSVASMSIASGSLGGSIMSDLSGNLIALDLAEPRLLDRFDIDEP